MRETKSTCCSCGVGCGVVIESEGDRIVGVRGDVDHPANFGRLCTKGSTLHLSARLDIPRLGARVVRRAQGDVAVFRNANDEVFALEDRCPHKGGPLLQGIVHGKHVTCPLHSWKICLDDGNAAAPDTGCAKRYPVKIERRSFFADLI